MIMLRSRGPASIRGSHVSKIEKGAVSRFTSDLQTFFEELKRRHVVRAATAYGVGAFVVLQAADLLMEALT